MNLCDCVLKGEGTELLIVAPGPLYKVAKEERDRLTQAILPLSKGIQSSGPLDEVLANKQCMALVSTLGVGIQIDDERTFNLKNLRYGKVIIVENQEEILRFMEAYMRPLLEANHVYLPETEEFLNPETRKLKVATVSSDYL